MIFANLPQYFRVTLGGGGRRPKNTSHPLLKNRLGLHLKSPSTNYKPCPPPTPKFPSTKPMSPSLGTDAMNHSLIPGILGQNFCCLVTCSRGFSPTKQVCSLKGAHHALQQRKHCKGHASCAFKDVKNQMTTIINQDQRLCRGGEPLGRAVCVHMFFSLARMGQG